MNVHVARNSYVVILIPKGGSFRWWAFGRYVGRDDRAS